MGVSARVALQLSSELARYYCILVDSERPWLVKDLPKVQGLGPLEVEDVGRRSRLGGSVTLGSLLWVSFARGGTALDGPVQDSTALVALRFGTDAA